jgi:hypothetical protein
MIYLVIKRKIYNDTYTVRYALVNKELAESFVKWANHDNQDEDTVYELLEQYVIK